MRRRGARPVGGRTAPRLSGLTYDTGALLAAEAGQRTVWLLHRRALERGVLPTVPAPVLAEAWRGGPQPMLARFLGGCMPLDFGTAVAYAAGAALGASGTRDVVDAAVVLAAAGADDIVVTSDPNDLQRIAEAAGLPVRLHRI